MADIMQQRANDDFLGHPVLFSDGGTLQTAFEALTSTRAIQRCPPAKAWGSLSVVKRTKGTVKDVYKGVHLETVGHNDWKKCLTGKACYGK